MLSGVLNITDGFPAGTTGTVGDVLTLIDNDGTDAVTGEFSNLPGNANVSLNNEDWHIRYDGGDGNDVVLQFGSGVNATVSIADAPDVAEGGNSVFTVSLSEASASEVTVKYSTTTGTAGSSDFTAATEQTLTFAAGDLQKTISVATIDDSEFEDTESFTITLTDPNGATIGTGQATGTVLDNDQPFQNVSSDGVTQTVAPGQMFEIPVIYQTQNADGSPAALQSNVLGFNLHFDSTVVDFIGTSISDIFAEGIQVVPNTAVGETDPQVVGDDFDASTDSVLVVAYSDTDPAIGLGWPNNPSTDGLVLYTAQFRAKSGFNGTTLNFSPNFTGNVTGSAGGFRFQSSPVTVQAGTVLPSLSIAAASPVSEGEDALFTVTLSAPSTETVSSKVFDRNGNGGWQRLRRCGQPDADVRSGRNSADDRDFDG